MVGGMLYILFIIKISAFEIYTISHSKRPFYTPHVIKLK